MNEPAHGKRGEALRAALSRNFPYLLILLAVHVLIYREYWLLQKFITGSDFFQLFVPAANFQSDCLREGSWPFWNPYINFI